MDITKRKFQLLESLIKEDEEVRILSLGTKNPTNKKSLGGIEIFLDKDSEGNPYIAINCQTGTHGTSAAINKENIDKVIKTLVSLKSKL